MECSECAENSRRKELRLFWRQVPQGDKRRLAAVVSGVTGAVVGWSFGRELGLLVGMFVAGSLGEIAGLMRYGSQPTVEGGEKV